ncbi:ribonuclease pancreatic-like [Sceloporus undulatus]|uniref:ribonuclease pancreatic-like n=1 Tax=Sceloporus undulatus TaxID=8520 RepID=UPI001C4C7723|nr:ribonuclease pancreatic-like [Sceloporus undulatus]
MRALCTRNNRGIQEENISHPKGNWNCSHRKKTHPVSLSSIFQGPTMLNCKVSCYLQVQAILLVILVVQSCEGQTWQDFQRKHVDYPLTPAGNPNAYCNLMMQRRGMTQPTCKYRNTFINADPLHIHDVCQIQGKYTYYAWNLFDSTDYFPVVDCNYIGGSPPNCQYQGTFYFQKRIRVACGEPVHLQAILP